MENGLNPRVTSGSMVERTANGWRLDIPAGGKGTYRLAQLDDYGSLSRRGFHHRPPWNMTLHARVSSTHLAGTWGFGLWNDPFGFSLGSGGRAGRYPSLPNVTWFFHGSPPNWLSLQDSLPANGFFAGTIASPRIPTLLMTPGLLAIPLLALRPLSRLFRRLAGRIIYQEAVAIPVDVTQWHEYSIRWLHDIVEFKIDQGPILQTSPSPVPPLGFLVWMDNQYAAWTPDGRFQSGMLENREAWLEIRTFKMNGQLFPGSIPGENSS
jgi:hypothetical protein